jgi:hypothetical protein
MRKERSYLQVKQPVLTFGLLALFLFSTPGVLALWPFFIVVSRMNAVHLHFGGKTFPGLLEVEEKNAK